MTLFFFPFAALSFFSATLSLSAATLRDGYGFQIGDRDLRSSLDKSPPRVTARDSFVGSQITAFVN
ncbi:hypothetical protein L484_010659 [Morus notabilis]|uniref:Legume lectin domain-containing protein n=1 Tax=Morus notabilis TaxID=981085 RepID=W9RZN2_9ROSA|nr:hypothetical protein L484_010659 [Morus notabilis]